MKALIDLDMKQKYLQQVADVSSALIAKMGRNENVFTDSLVRSVLRYVAMLGT